MAVATETVAIEALNIVAGVEIPVAMQIYQREDLYVLYGIDGLIAVQNTDYTYELLGDPTYYAKITPTVSLINKINALIASDPDEINRIVVRRILDYKTASTPASVQSTRFTSFEFDNITMRFQQLAEKLNRALVLSASFIGVVNQLAIQELVPGRVLITNDTGDGIIAGPNGSDIADAQLYASSAAQDADDAATAANDAAAQKVLAQNAAGAAATSAATAAAAVGPAINAAPALAGANIADNDRVPLYDVSASQLVYSLYSEFIAGIFKVTRYIDNARFLATNFRFRNAGGFDTALTFLATAARTYTFGDRNLIINPIDEFIADIQISSSVAAINIPDLGNYDQVDIEGTLAFSGSVAFLIQCSSDNGVTWLTTGTYVTQALVSSTSSASAATLGTQTGMNVTANNGIAATAASPTYMKFSCADLNKTRPLRALSEIDNSTTGQLIKTAHNQPSTVARNALRIIPTSGTAVFANLKVKGRR